MEYKDVTDIISGAQTLLDRLEGKVRGSWLHRWFWHGVNVQWYTPPVLFSTTWELDYPFRKSRTILLRYSFRRSLVLGFWGKTGYDEDTALLEATVYGRKRRDDERIHFDEVRAYDDRPTAFEGSSLPLRGDRPQLRVRATFDDGLDG